MSVFLGFWIAPDLRFGYALVTGLLFRAAYAIYDLPQNALMALATSDSAARDRVAATRIWFSGVATLVVAGAVGPLIAGREEATAWLYVIVSLSMAGVAVLSAGLLARIVRRAPVDATRSPQANGSREPRPLPALFWLLMGLMFITSLATPLFSKIEPYFAVYLLESPGWGGAIVIAMALGITLGQVFWRGLAARASRAAVLAVAALMQIAALGLFSAFAPDGREGLAVTAFIFGLGNGGVGMALWSGFSEVVARFPRQGGAGLAYGRFTATAKVALALGSLGLGAGLELTGYREGSTEGLLLLMTAVPALGAVVCLVLATIWSRLTTARSEETTLPEQTWPNRE